jgi:hypothetical protein
MNEQEFKVAKQLVWDTIIGKILSSNPELAEALGKDLSDIGVKVLRIGKKPKSRNESIVFTIGAYKVRNLDLKFLSEESAKNWHNAKNQGLNTLMKAPDEAFLPLVTEYVEEVIYLSQAISLAYRLGSLMPNSKEMILAKRGTFNGKTFGL